MTMTNALPSVRAYRLDNIDMLRGLAVVVMALDHVRDYFILAGAHDPMTDPNVGPALFFTRWVTHFCAPVFVFLAGASAGLMTARKDKSQLGGFLLKRGCWLIVVEWFIVSTAWTFAPSGIEQFHGLTLVPMQVIWAIGASMVVLSGMQFLGRRACFVVGAAIVFAHNVLDPVWPTTTPLGQGAPWWAVFHSQASYVLGPFLFAFAYPLLPWIGVMLLGFGGAAAFEQEPHRRDRLLVLCGLAAIVGFALLRALDAYGDPNPWQLQPALGRTMLDFLNVTKYPPSLLYVLITLGPAAILCAFSDRIPGIVKGPLVTFGRAPFAFYIAHLYLIHALSVVYGTLQGFAPEQFLTMFFFFPSGYGLGLASVYLVWLAVVATLYPLSRWMATLKARRRDWWLSYV